MNCWNAIRCLHLRSTADHSRTPDRFFLQNLALRHVVPKRSCSSAHPMSFAHDLFSILMLLQCGKTKKLLAGRNTKFTVDILIVVRTLTQRCCRSNSSAHSSYHNSAASTLTSKAWICSFSSSICLSTLMGSTSSTV